MINLNEDSRYRFGVAARAVAAIGGAYLLTATAMSLLSVLLPLARADAVIVGTMLSFLIYAGVVLWVFAARSALRAWTGILAASGLLSAVLYWYRSMQ